MDYLEHEILVVEDHEDSASCLVRLLEKSGFTHFVIARTGQEAIQAARRWRFDLALCDIGLPDMDGCDLFQELSTDWPMKGIAVTGYGMPSDIDRIKKAGFSGHVLKPCMIDDVISAIRTAMAPPSNHAPAFANP
jgi:CheY-like chemotaxis protein